MVHVGVGNSGSSGSSATATYNAVAMTELWDSGAVETFFANAGYRTATEPAIAAVSIVVTFSTIPDEAAIVGFSLQGVNTAAPITAAAPAVNHAGSGAPVTSTLTGETGGLFVGYIYANATNMAASGGDAMFGKVTVGGSVTGAGFTKAGAATGTLAATLTGGAQWTANGVCYAPAAVTVPSMDSWYQPPSIPRWSKPTVVPSGMGDRSRVVGMAA